MNFGRIIILSIAIFDVSSEIKSVTEHVQKVRKEQKHINVISSWGFHHLQQANCAGEGKEMVS